MKIIFNQIDPKAKIPIKGTPGSCCHDLVITKIEFIDKNKVEVSYGFSTEFSSKYKAVIVPRSSFTHKSWIMANSPGQIDSDYFLEWKTRLEAIPTWLDIDFEYEGFPYKVGDRITQFYIEEVIDIEFIDGSNRTNYAKDKLEDLKKVTTFNRTGGFGSTGE